MSTFGSERRLVAARDSIVNDIARTVIVGGAIDEKNYIVNARNIRLELAIAKKRLWRKRENKMPLMV